MSGLEGGETPAYDLDAIKAAIGRVDRLEITRTALQSAASLGFDSHAIVETVQKAEKKMFFKSMTTFADHRAWQDVYHVPVGDLVIYLKFQSDVIAEFRVVSFKERT